MRNLFAWCFALAFPALVLAASVVLMVWPGVWLG